MNTYHQSFTRYFIRAERPSIGFMPFGLLGLLLLILVFVYGLTAFAKNTIEAEVKELVISELHNNDLGDIVVQVDGQDVRLSGIANEIDGPRALAIALASKGSTWLGEKQAPRVVVGDFDKPLDRPEETLPAKALSENLPTWGKLVARVDSDTLTLEGVVGSQHEKKSLLAKPQPFSKVVDRIQVSGSKLMTGSSSLASRVVDGVSRCTQGQVSSRLGVFSANCQVSRTDVNELQRQLSLPVKGAKVGSVVLRINNDCDNAFSHVLAKSTLHFSVGSARLKPESAPVLSELIDIIEYCPSRIRVEGHTDVTGDAQANVYLSQARADSVVKALIDRGVSPKHLLSKGFGSEKPKVLGNSSEAHAQNRRIEFYVMNEEAN